MNTNQFGIIAADSAGRLTRASQADVQLCRIARFFALVSISAFSFTHPRESRATRAYAKTVDAESNETSLAEISVRGVGENLFVHMHERKNIKRRPLRFFGER